MQAERFSGLINIFEDAMTAVSRQSNDFPWAGEEDRSDALAEIRAIIAKLRRSSAPDRLRMAVLFAPTGPLQELSMSDGWASTFLALADRFDRELNRLDG